MNKAILYHAHCADGFGAAWASWRRLGDGASYLPVQHGNPPPELAVDSEVYILDFAYPRDVIVGMKERYRDLRVIDHHQSAEKELEGLDYAIFDNDKSAAVLAWEFFNPGEPVPELLRYVMDRDLWRYELPQSREVFAALSSYPMEFEVWSRLDVSRLAEEGKPILRYQGELVKLVCEHARIEELAGHRIPVANTPIVGSEVCAELLRRFPEAPFVATYFDRSDGKRQWSLRSRDDFDVSAIARRFRNGGHRQAAGFETELPQDFMPQAPEGDAPPVKRRTKNRRRK